MVRVFNDPEGDEHVQTLLQQIAEANPEAESVSRLTYRNEPMNMITVVGTCNADITIPDNPRFDVELSRPAEPDEDMKERLKEKDRVPDGYWDDTVGPATLTFQRVGWRVATGGIEDHIKELEDEVARRENELQDVASELQAMDVEDRGQYLDKLMRVKDEVDMIELDMYKIQELEALLAGRNTEEDDE